MFGPEQSTPSENPLSRPWLGLNEHVSLLLRIETIPQECLVLGQSRDSSERLLALCPLTQPNQVRRMMLDCGVLRL